ncbi:hypothetical protein Poly24_48020 [Rosistilla carotiformis]|uniref:Uncharacterized protein n=1 Tax=Rosistilla carotiformis TaxID=2528017 RepID=A0A518JZU7_9BACT|nr:hypothetical protein [Rosistilla carotiformis]QDV71069.1 hypothetical protein Poly24_48020 [Rosistilla carotiformis]
MQKFASPGSFHLGVFVVASLVGSPLAAQVSDNRLPNHGDLSELQIEALGAGSYRMRQRTSRAFVDAGPAAIEVLRGGLDHNDAEIRLQCQRLLIEIRERQTERELQHLLTEYDPARTYRLPGWKPFAEACGDDASARGLFKRLLDRDASFMRWLQRVHDDPSYDIENQLEDQFRFLSPDTQRLNSGDLLSWSRLLLAGTNAKICQVPVLGSHIRCGLQCGPTIHSLTHGANSTATMRLVRSWLRRQSTTTATRATLRIAMLYECDTIAEQMARTTLDSHHASPASVQTALFYYVAHQPESASLRLANALDDQRVCQVWQIASLRRRAIQTQVRDTALALLLHLRGVDPRTVGFRDLQADPITIYGEQTFGFETDQERDAAHDLGQRLLAGE